MHTKPFIVPGHTYPQSPRPWSSCMDKGICWIVDAEGQHVCRVARIGDAQLILAIVNRPLPAPSANPVQLSELGELLTD